MKLSISYGPIERKVIEALEQVWGFKLPNDYKKFLIENNGGEPIENHFQFKNNSNNGSIVHFFLGINPINYLNLLMYIKNYSDRIPENMFPIAYDPCGNLILLSVKGPDRGKVYFWDHELEADPGQEELPSYDNITLISDNFDEFINSLHDEDRD